MPGVYHIAVETAAGFQNYGCIHVPDWDLCAVPGPVHYYYQGPTGAASAGQICFDIPVSAIQSTTIQSIWTTLIVPDEFRLLDSAGGMIYTSGNVSVTNDQNDIDISLLSDGVTASDLTGGFMTLCVLPNATSFVPNEITVFQLDLGCCDFGGDCSIPQRTPWPTISDADPTACIQRSEIAWRRPYSDSNAFIGQGTQYFDRGSVLERLTRSCLYGGTVPGAGQPFVRVGNGCVGSVDSEGATTPCTDLFINGLTNFVAAGNTVNLSFTGTPAENTLQYNRLKAQFALWEATWNT